MPCIDCCAVTGDHDRYMAPPARSLRRAFRRVWMRAAYDHLRRALRAELPPPGSGVIVDCGCGPGDLLALLCRWRRGDVLAGIDLSYELLAAARDRAPGVLFVQASAQRLPLRTGIADAVIVLHVVEHLPRPEEFLAEAARFLRPGGVLVLATPNPAGIGARVSGRRWIGFGDPHHVSLRTPDQWRRTVRDHGFTIRRDGTTGLSGLWLFRRLPVALVNWVPMAVFGFFPWGLGEAYVCIARNGESR